MSAPRLRRLQADYDRLLVEFYEHPYVAIQPLGSLPPERYRVTYKLQGAIWDEEREVPKRVTEHVVLITLTDDYPRHEPVCVVESGHFHPNIGEKYGIPNYICIGDVWSPTQELWQTVAKIGEMLQYRIYNVDSPLNPLAARWAMDWEDEYLPLGDRDLLQPEIDINLGDESAAATTVLAPEQLRESS